MKAPYSPSTRAVVLVGLLAIVLPVLSRTIASPFTLLLVSPILLFLLFLGYVAFTVYAAWLLDLNPPTTEGDLRRAARPFAFSTPAAWQAVLTRSQWSQNVPKTLPALYPESPEVSDALNDILKLVMRDFVSSWYNDLSSSPAFPIAVTSLIHASLQQLFDRATAIDASALIVKKVVPKVTAHIEQFRQSEVALRGAGLERRLTQSEELDLLLASRYASKGVKLHPAIENLSTTFTKQTEEMHLRKLVDRALLLVLPPKERKSKAIRLVVREILTCTVIFPIVEMISDPDFWNRTIDQVAGAAIHQQQLISKVRNLIDSQIPRNPSSKPAPASAPIAYTERITTRTSAKQFESFLRSIGHCSSLLDARRLKNDISGEIRRTRLLLANHDKGDWIDGEKTEDVVAFLDRLFTAKRKVEERIAVLGGESNPNRQPTSPTPSSPPPLPSLGLSPTGASRPKITLRDILRNPNSLSYFMEFMDRRHRSLPVQFWLTVESFKNPLESVESDNEGDEDDVVQVRVNLGKGVKAGGKGSSGEEEGSLREDITMIYELYFAESARGGEGLTKTATTAKMTIPPARPGLSAISKKYIETIREFVEASKTDAQDKDAKTGFLSVEVQRKVRRSVLLAQKQVEREMVEQDFEDFERSELWFRAAGDAAFAGHHQQQHSQHHSSPQQQQDQHHRQHPQSRQTQPLAMTPSDKDALLGIEAPPLKVTSSSPVIPSGSRPKYPLALTPTHGIIAPPSLSHRSISSTSNRSAQSQSKVLTHTPSNIEVLMSPLVDDAETSSLEGVAGGGAKKRAPLFDNDPEDEAQRAEERRMEEIHAALTDIMALEEGGKDGPGSSKRDSLGVKKKIKAKSITPSRRSKGSKMFSDDEDEEEDSHGSPGDAEEIDHDPGAEAEAANDEPEADQPTTSPFHLAAPGDLQLKYEIARLSSKISHLEAQEVILSTLIKKAELTGDRSELRLLEKSMESLRKEVRGTLWQKEQYVAQERENRLVPERTRVKILSLIVGEEKEGSMAASVVSVAGGNGSGTGAGNPATGNVAQTGNSSSGGKKSVVRYLIEVQQLGPDGNFSSGWVVARRYNEFFTMHNKLKERYLAVRGLDFPGKRLLVANLSDSFLDQRKVGLERYLQGLVAIPVVCESEELRTFLSRDSPFIAAPLQESSSASSSKGGAQSNNTSAFSGGTNLVRNVYRSVAESIDDMFFGPSMLDVMIQRLTKQAAEFAGIVGSGVHDEELVVQALSASTSAAAGSSAGAGGSGGGSNAGKEEANVAASLGKWATGDLKPLEGETSVSTFSGPICDLVLAVFELDKRNNWLRRQAIVIILQQVLGGTVERKVRENVKALLSPPKLLSYLDLFRDNLWPGGKLRPPGAPRTTEEKVRTRDEANRKLSSLVPDLAANMIGRSNARRGARRIFAVMQNRRLNQHIVYTILDELFDALFPETIAEQPPPAS